MRISLFGLVASFLVGCMTSDPMPAEQQRSEFLSAQVVPTTSGSFVGHYIVPAPPDIASAATFVVADVDWTVASGTATLHYELPLGLVGGVLPVTLSGPVAAGATSIQLTSTVGTGWCTAQGTQITCGEAFDDLGALPMSQAVVEQVAAQDTVTVASRVAVANIFSSDPIGTVDFDLSVPADDDDGGGGHHGGGGGGGGHGGGHGGDGGGGGGGRH